MLSFDRNHHDRSSPELLRGRNDIQVWNAHETLVRLIHRVPAYQARVQYISGISESIRKADMSATQDVFEANLLSICGDMLVAHPLSSG
jgi:hypothetical protein